MQLAYFRFLLNNRTTHVLVSRLVKMLFHLVVVLLPAFVSGCSDASRPTDAEPATHRVISLAPNITEIVCAIGAEDLLVGRTTACDYPPETVESIPVIGDFGAPSLEMIMSAAPTLILETDLADESIGKRMSQLSLPRKRIACRTLFDIPTAIEEIGGMLDRKEKADALAADLRSAIDRMRKRAKSATDRPSVYVEVWHDPMTTAGRHTFLSELIALAGGENIANDVEEDYFEVSPEWVIARNPDVVLCLYMSRGSEARSTVINRAGWQHLKAIRTERVFDGFDNNLLLRPGPRFPLGVEAIHSRLTGGTHP